MGTACGAPLARYARDAVTALPRRYGPASARPGGGRVGGRRQRARVSAAGSAPGVSAAGVSAPGSAPPEAVEEEAGAPVVVSARGPGQVAQGEPGGDVGVVEVADGEVRANDP